MEVASVRLNDQEKEFLTQLISEGKYQSASDVLKAGLRKLMLEEKKKTSKWKNRREVREYFSSKPSNLHGLEEIHDET